MPAPTLAKRRKAEVGRARWAELPVADAWGYIQRVARRRMKLNRTRRHYANNGSLELLGAANEVALRRYLGLGDRLHDSFDGGRDLVYRGVAIDAKATRWSRQPEKLHLQYQWFKERAAPVLVLGMVSVKRRRVRLLGYAYASQLLAQPVNSERPTPCRELPVTELEPMWKLRVTFPDSPYPGGHHEPAD